MSILSTCFPCSRSTQLNGVAVSWLLAHPRRLCSLRCKASAPARARCCFGVLDSQHSGVCNLSFTKVQWAQASFSFWFCPHSVPGFYPFTDMQLRLFHHVCFWLVDSLCFFPFGHLLHMSAPAGSCVRRLISVVKLKSLQCFMLLRSERIHRQFIFPLLFILLYFFSHLRFLWQL